MSHRKAPPAPEAKDPPLPPSLVTYVKMAGGPGHELKAYRMWAEARRGWRRVTGRLLPDDLHYERDLDGLYRVGDRIIKAPQSAK